MVLRSLELSSCDVPWSCSVDVPGNWYSGFSSQRYTLVWSRPTVASQFAQLRKRAGPSGKMMVSLATSAWMHTPSAVAGSVKLSARPKITGWDSCTMSVTMGWNTSASNKNVAVSDQTRTDALIFCPPIENPSFSIFVNGQGPAMHDTLAFRNSFPAPASKDMEPMAAFQRPSGEHGSCRLHGTFPVFCT